MTIYVVLAGYNYYPDWDNSKGYFLRLSDANRLQDKLLREGKYDWTEIVQKEVTG